MCDVGSNRIRNAANAVRVGMQEIARPNLDSTHAHRLVNRSDVAVAMRTQHAVAERRESQAPYLIEIARRTAGDDTERSEALVTGAHHFSERRSHRRVVKVLKNYDGRPREIAKPRHLFVTSRKPRRPFAERLSAW